MWKYHSHSAQYLKHLFPYYCLSTTPTAPGLCASLPAVGFSIPNTGCAYIVLRDLPLVPLVTPENTVLLFWRTLISKLSLRYTWITFYISQIVATEVETILFLYRFS